MRAAVLREFGSDPEIEALPVPEPGAGEALLRVLAAGLCATDLKVIEGALGGSVQLPRIPGHEIAGEVVACDERPQLVGRHAACHLYANCGECEFCRRGRPTLCRQVRRPGIERDGGLAEYVVVDQRSLISFGRDLDPALAAVAMDAVTTPWGGLVGRGRLERGEDVAVVGCGGLGSNAVQIAKAFGSRPAVIDPDPSHRVLAIELGAELAVGPEEIERAREWSRDGIGVDLAIDTSGHKEGFEAAAALLRPGGRLVCNGYRPGVAYGLDSARLVLEEITVLGSRVAGYDQAVEALAAVEDGRIVPEIMESMELEQLGRALGVLRAGKVLGRVVLRP